MKKMLLVAAASTAILASTAFAAEDQFYVKVEAGATMLNKAKDKATDIKMKAKTVPIFGAGVGYYVMDNLRAELALDFLSNPEFKKTVANEPYIGWTTYVKHKGKVASLLVNGFFDFYQAGAFNFYVGAGIGAAQISEKNYYGATTAGTTVTAPVVSVKKTYNFAYQVGLGTSADVADGVKVELGYSWRDYGKTKSKTVTVFGETENIGKTAYKGHNIIAGVRFDI